jgi:ubiquinone/menaquinone biosynthesis C-methylase UbiE
VTSENESEYIASCCADIYSHPLVMKLLDGVLHPGGLALTAHLADSMGINSNSVVLDLACGDGRTAIFLATKYGCKITGIDAGLKMIEKANELAKRSGVTDNVQFSQNLVGKLPFDNCSFDSIISECSFCTFPNKEKAANEVYQLLKPEGILGITDVTLKNRESLHPKLCNLLGRVLCVADAVSSDTYIGIFKKAGFNLQESTSHSNLFDDLVKRVISNARMLQATSSTQSENQGINTNLENAIRLARLIEKEIKSNNLGYDLFIFKK